MNIVISYQLKIPSKTSRNTNINRILSNSTLRLRVFFTKNKPREFGVQVKFKTTYYLHSYTSTNSKRGSKSVDTLTKVAFVARCHIINMSCNFRYTFFQSSRGGQIGSEKYLFLQTDKIIQAECRYNADSAHLPISLYLSLYL